MRICEFCRAPHYISPYVRCYRCGAPLPSEDTAPAKDDALDEGDEFEQTNDTQRQA